MKSQLLPDGRTLHTEVARPYAVRLNGRTRSFATLAAARRAAEPGSHIFFDYAPGCGVLLERV